MNIVFVSVNYMSITDFVGNDSTELGCQLNETSEGLQPTYGMMADSLDMVSLVITFTWGE